MSRPRTILADVPHIAKHFDVPPVPVVQQRTRWRTTTDAWSWGGRRTSAAAEHDLGLPRQTHEICDQGDPAGRVCLVGDLANLLWEMTVVDQRYRCLIALTLFATPRMVVTRTDDLWRSGGLPP